MEVGVNRIYQGRVTHIDLLADKAKKGEDPLVRECSKEESTRLLWDFHELFQDAINYYLVCLMALATAHDNPIFKIRERVDGSDPEHNVWNPFRRKGQKRRGMRTVASYVGLDPESATLADCCAKVLEGNDSPPDLLDAALRELLQFCDGDGKIQQEGRSMLPRFCNPDYKGDFNTGATANLREYGGGRLGGDFHSLSAQDELDRFAEEVELGWVVNISQRGKIATGEASRQRLLKSVAHFGQFYKTHDASTQMDERVERFLSDDPAHKDRLLSIEATLKGMDVLDLPEIQPNERAKSDQVEALLLFKYFPSPETAELLKVSFPRKEKPKTAAKKGALDSFGDDPIKLARRSRGYVFNAFSSLDRFGGTNANPMWIEFDIAAFKEALKAFHQAEQKGEERQKERERRRQILDYMVTGKGNLKSAQADDESFEPPPVLKGDRRIERLEAVHEALKRPSEMAGEDAEEYGLSPRTIRGFEKLAEKWNRAKVGSLSASEAQARLKQELDALQKETPDVIGSVDLFRELMQPENWIVWQQAFENTPEDYAERGYSRNPLEAYVQKMMLEEEIERLGEPIRFTPADPRYSRRQYPFGDKQTFKNPNGQYRHEPSRMAVVVGMAIRNGGNWEKQRVRMHYSAPRFLREGLRTMDGNLLKMPWLQPMMEALGVDLAFPQDMHNVPVLLMPSCGRNGEVVVNLNFPVTLDEAGMVAALGRKERWAGQFAGGKDKGIYLRWPNDEWPKTWMGGRWYQDSKPFRMVAVDLGVRDAGALALIECRPDADFGLVKEGQARQCRLLGTAGGRQWHAAVQKTKMLRLPGEDALVWRNGTLQQEFSGEKGRLADERETLQAQAIVAALGYPDLMKDDGPGRRFLAHQNKRVLLALRWAQKRLARWQGWSWMLLDGQKADQAQAGLANDEAISGELRVLVESGKWNVAAARLNVEIEALKAVLVAQLVAIANRVVPLRGRNWEWAERQDEAGFVLRQTERGSDPSKTKIAGQRGLSIERIELIEDLRKRCQSLNRALQQEPGKRPVLGYRAKGREAADPCPDLLEKLDHLREQRVSQTAHVILAEALGVQLKPHSKTKGERAAKDIHGEYEKVRAPVDFIVLEDLNRYLTSQGRSRTENSRLMKWCHRAILGKLKELCETYGIPVLEASAAYSSRFSAKDGTPGFRAVEVTSADRAQYPWKKMLESQDADAIRLFRMLEEVAVGQHPEKPRKLLAPLAGGPIFVPMAGKEAQADINAAINLGLRAVAAPEALEIHHKIRTEKAGESVLKPLIRSKREKARWENARVVFEFGEGVKLERNSNCFPLVGFVADFEVCEADGRLFATGKGLWGSIKKKQWNRVHELNQERIRRWRQKGLLDDIPM